MESLEKFLVEHDFLAGMNKEYIDLMVGCSSNVRFKEGEYICREGREANMFYILREGKVSLDIHMPQRGPVAIMTLDAGQVLGWSWLFPPHRWQFDALAKTDIRAIAFDGECMRKKCEENHDLGYEIMKRFSQVLAERLQSTRLQLMDVYCAKG